MIDEKAPSTKEDLLTAIQKSWNHHKTELKPIIFHLTIDLLLNVGFKRRSIVKWNIIGFNSVLLLLDWLPYQG